MTDSMTRVVLLGGPLDGYHHELAVVDWREPLRFNSLREPGFRQHVYHHRGKDVSNDGPVYEYVGDDVSNLQRLEHPGIDLPGHAFQ